MAIAFAHTVITRWSSFIPQKSATMPKSKLQPQSPQLRSSGRRARAIITSQSKPAAPVTAEESPPPESAKKKQKRTTDPDEQQECMASSPIAEKILNAERVMSRQLSSKKFQSPVTHVYDPLTYAWSAHEWYVRKYSTKGARILLVGMNPGPWGMAQTGVPFGEISAVRHFLHMPETMEIAAPKHENPARPVTGLSCKRAEVSGRRLWTEWAAAHYKTPAAFFQTFFVHNYCPLMFLESSGRNRTPIKLKAAERAEVERVCDAALRAIVTAMKPLAVCGIGGYAKERCMKVLKSEVDKGLVVATVLHPSPASPAANRGWVEAAVKQIDAVLLSIEDNPINWNAIGTESDDNEQI